MNLVEFKDTVEDLNYYNEFYKDERLFIDDFGWREVDHITANLASVMSTTFIAPILSHVTNDDRVIIVFGAKAVDIIKR